MTHQFRIKERRGGFYGAKLMFFFPINKYFGKMLTISQFLMIIWNLSQGGVTL